MPRPIARPERRMLIALTFAVERAFPESCRSLLAIRHVAVARTSGLMSEHEQTGKKALRTPRLRIDEDDSRPGSARAQFEKRRSRNPARRARRIHGSFGFGEIVAGLRHDLRRGAAPLRREPVGLRAPVPRDDAEAGRRSHRRPVARHLDRTKDDEQESALDRRHGHRNLRLPAPAVRARRRSLFAGDRPADRKSDGHADGRPRAGATRRHAAA